jgi:hypothetical protein
MSQLQLAVRAEGGKVVSVGKDGRYVRAEFPIEIPILGKDIDDCEFYFTPKDVTVQFRSERRSGRPDFGENRRRLQRIREQLRWDLLPVLRNRQRALFFFESPLDNFGPALYDQLRPGQEPTPGEAEILARQGDNRRTNKKSIGSSPFRTDDLGVENEDGLLDKAARDWLRATCDPKQQICE